MLELSILRIIAPKSIIFSKLAYLFAGIYVASGKNNGNPGEKRCDEYHFLGGELSKNNSENAGKCFQGKIAAIHGVFIPVARRWYSLVTCLHPLEFPVGLFCCSDQEILAFWFSQENPPLKMAPPASEIIAPVIKQ